MKAREIIFLTSLLGVTGGGVACDSMKGQTTTNIEQSPIVSDSVVGFDRKVELRCGHDLLRETIRDQLVQILDCEGEEYFLTFEGLYKEKDISDEKRVALLSNDLICADGACTMNILVYEDGKMINGFSVVGICGKTKEEIIKLLGSGLKPEIELSGVIDKKVVF